MKYNFYINSKSALDRLRILFKRLRIIGDNQIIDNINELYIDSKLLLSNIDDEKVFANIYKINKDINIIPNSQLLYNEFTEEDFTNDEPSLQFQQKINYLQNFYEENEDFEVLYYNFSKSSFLKYSNFFDEMIEKINTDPSVLNSSLLKYLKINLPQQIHLSKKISPFIFIENSRLRNIKTFDNFFEIYDKIHEIFDTFILYSPLNYIKNINRFRKKYKISEFKNILLWFPDFNEITASYDEIKDLKDTLKIIYELNNNLIYLFGGMMIGKYLSDYIKELICRKDIYPGYRIIPTIETFGRRKKNLFFPQYGRITKLETIASPPYIDMYECNCLSCSDYRNGVSFNKKLCLEDLEESSTRRDYHNYHSFLIKLGSNEVIERYPKKSLDNIKLDAQWRRALSE